MDSIWDLGSQLKSRFLSRITRNRAIIQHAYSIPGSKHPKDNLDETLFIIQREPPPPPPPHKTRFLDPTIRARAKPMEACIHARAMSVLTSAKLRNKGAGGYRISHRVQAFENLTPEGAFPCVLDPSAIQGKARLFDVVEDL